MKAHFLIKMTVIMSGKMSFCDPLVLTYLISVTDIIEKQLSNYFLSISELLFGPYSWGMVIGCVMAAQRT